MPWFQRVLWLHRVLWFQRVLWVALPFGAGTVLGDALGIRCRGVQIAGSGLAWGAWALGLIALAVAHPLSCTALRIVAPAAALTTTWAALVADAPAAVTVVAITTAGASALLALGATFGERCVNGPAYPNERRFLLRPPGPLLLGPLQLAWALVAGGVIVGPLLLGAGAVLPGVITLVAGVALAVLLSRSLHSLSRRFVVFVPAGFVLHDLAALGEPVLFPKQGIEAFRPAPADSDSLDLTMQAPGLALEVILREKIEISRVDPRRRTTQPGATARFLFAPTRPGRVLAEASARHLVAADPSG